MNKKIVTILIVLAVLFIAAPVFAATTGTLNLAGRVGKVVAIVVTPNASATTLDLSTTVLVGAPTAIASINEKANFGYDVTVYSANTGTLVDSVSSDVLAYSLVYDGDDIGQPPAVGSPLNITSSAGRTGGTGVDKTLGIYYTADAGLTASTLYTYVDTLTFTITAK